jgi:DNA-binding transcriptional MerR regulator
MTVGGLARRTGLTVKAIRRYEAPGLIYSAGRSEGGYRLFDESALWCAQMISTLRSLGLTIKEIDAPRALYLERPGEPIGPRLPTPPGVCAEQEAGGDEPPAGRGAPVQAAAAGAEELLERQCVESLCSLFGGHEADASWLANEGGAAELAAPSSALVTGRGRACDHRRRRRPAPAPRDMSCSPWSSRCPRRSRAALQARGNPR